MPDAQTPKSYRWRKYHFTCPICGAKQAISKALADRRYSERVVRTRLKVCDAPACQATDVMRIHFITNVVNLNLYLQRLDQITRSRKTPEGFAHYAAKYGPASGRPIRAFDPTRLTSHPKTPLWRHNAYQNQLAKNRNLNALLGMFNMARKASYPVLTPQAASRIRGSIMTRVPKYLEMADEVMQGDRKWSATQARVFATLLNKVVPDLSASFVQHEHTTRDLRELSREELERIARGDDAISVEYSDASQKSREAAPLLEPDPPGTGPGDEEPEPR